MDRPVFERKPIPQPTERRRVRGSVRFESEAYYRRGVIAFVERRERGIRLIRQYLESTFPMDGLEGECWSEQYGKRADEAKTLRQDLEASLRNLPMEPVK